MTKFAQPKLEELMVKRRGSVDPSKFPSETFELFSIPAFDTGEAVVVTGSKIGSSKQNVEPGDLLLSKIVPHIRRAWVVTSQKGYRQIASGEWMIFKHSDAFPGYLRHLLTSDWFHPKLMNTVAGVGCSLVRARPSEIARIEIPLPPLAEQKRIAAILDKADAIRRKRQQALRLTDDFLRSVFLDMFGDPVTNSKKLPKVALSEIIKLKSGNSLTAKDMTPNGSYPVYGGNGINGYHDQYMFKERKIVLGRVGAYCGAVHYTQPYSWITDNALFVDQMKRPMNSIFLVDSLRIANLNQYAGQAGQPLISGGRIYPIEILEPSSNQQDAYAGIIEKTHATRENHMTALKSSACLFSSLQHRAFRGEL